MAEEDGAPRARYGEAFWRAHHEAWQRQRPESAGILRGGGALAEGVRQLAGQVQGRTATAGTEAAVALRQCKSQS